MAVTHTSDVGIHQYLQLLLIHLSGESDAEVDFDFQEIVRTQTTMHIRIKIHICQGAWCHGSGIHFPS